VGWYRHRAKRILFRLSPDHVHVDGGSRCADKFALDFSWISTRNFPLGKLIHISPSALQPLCCVAFHAVNYRQFVFPVAAASIWNVFWGLVIMVDTYLCTFLTLPHSLFCSSDQLPALGYWLIDCMLSTCYTPCTLALFRYNTHGCCNGQVYDRDDYICCRGQLVSKKYGSSTGCCGTTAYNYKTQVCCSGVVRPRTYGSYTYCCKTSIYDYRESVCCRDGTVRDRIYGRNSSCCGTDVYNYQTHVCCKDTIVHKLYGIYSRCCSDSVINGKYYSCCGGTTSYHRSIHRCCSGVVRDRAFGSYSSCCGTVVYDRRKSKCCRGVLHCKDSDSGSVYCCGSETYSYSKEICCYNCPGIIKAPSL